MTSARFVELILEDIRATGLTNLPHARPNDLSCELHPMLRQSRWRNTDNDTWRILRPILCLSSLILRSHASFLFLFSAINAKRIEDFQLSLTHGDKIHTIGRIDPYSHKDQSICDVRQELDQNLELFANHLEWSVIDSKDKRWLGQAQDAVTYREDSREIFFQNYRRRGNEGCGCNVYLGSRRLDLIRELESREQNPETICAILRAQVACAVVICHEVVHVVYAGSHRDRFEPFWEDQNFVELGQAWEEEVFGGSMLGDDDVDDEFYFSKFPQADAEPDPVSGFITRRPGSKGSSTYYVVPMPYVQRISTQALWENFMPSLDASLLKIPKVEGWRLKAEGPVDPLWRESQSSEGRWPDSQGQVRRPLRRSAVVYEPISRRRYPSRSSSPSSSRSKAEPMPGSNSERGYNVQL